MKQNMLQDWQQVNKPSEEFEDTKGVISTHHFFRNACTKLGSLRFSQFSGC
jgi:hypothetical protein